MSTKTFCVLAGLIGTAAVAVVPMALGAPWWARLLVVVAAACGTAWWSRDVFLGGAVFAEVGYGRRLRMAQACTGAVAVHALWAVVVPLDLAPWPWVAGVLAVVGLVEWLIAAGWDYRVTRVVPRAELAVPAAYLAQVVPEDAPRTPEGLMRAVLAEIGRDHYDIVGKPVMLDYGVSWTLRCLTPLQAAERAVCAAQAANPDGKRPTLTVKDLTPLSSKDAEDIGSAIMALTPVEVMTDWIEVVPQRVPGRVVVTVTTEDVMAKAIPYPLDATPRDRDRMDLGLTARSTTVHVNPRQHWVIVGPTGSGKSAVENVVIAEGVLRGVVMVCGAEKVWSLLEDWLDQFLGQDVDLPIDWAVQGMRDTLQMMAAVMSGARYRQNLSAAQKVGLLPVWIVVTESPRVMKDKVFRVEWEGRPYFACEITGHGARSTLSSQFYWVWSAQGYEHDMWGDEAASIKESAGVTIVCRSRNADERRRAFGDAWYGLPDLYSPGENYVQDHGDPVRVKGWYPQESDPTKPVLHDGPTVVEIARVRAGQRNYLDEGTAAAMGPVYAGRPRRMTIEYKNYLRGVGVLAGPVVGVRDEDAELDAELDEFLTEVMPRRAIGPAPVAPELAAAVPVVAEVEPERTWADRIMQVINEAGRPLWRKEIRVALAATGGEPTEGVLNNVLGDLKRTKRLVQPSVGVYASPNLTDLTSPSSSPVSAGVGEGGRVR